jgi:hypothetical protein
MRDFSTYEAYIERYKMFYSEEGDGRPPILDQSDFQHYFNVLRDSYQTMYDLRAMGKWDQARQYYQEVINPLENLLAIADGSDNFIQGKGE